MINEKSNQKNRDRLLQRLQHDVNREKPPRHWRRLSTTHVGGVFAVGFSKSSDYLLVVSHAGRGLIDCSTGEKIARDRDEYAGIDDSNLHCRGIGPVEDELILVAGISGGGLPIVNRHGETIEVVSPNWPIQDLILSQDSKSVLHNGNPSTCFLLASGYLRAFGFSYSGNHLVIADGSEVDLWHRSE